jgi:hypothetical protein
MIASKIPIKIIFQFLFSAFAISWLRVRHSSKNLPVFLSVLPASAFRFNRKKDSHEGTETRSFQIIFDY